MKKILIKSIGIASVVSTVITGMVPVSAETIYLDVDAPNICMPWITTRPNHDEDKERYRNVWEHSRVSGYTDADGEYFDRGALEVAAWQITEEQAEPAYENYLKAYPDKIALYPDVDAFILDNSFVAMSTFFCDETASWVNADDYGISEPVVLSSAPEDGRVEGSKQWWNPELFYKERVIKKGGSYATAQAQLDASSQIYVHPTISAINAGETLTNEDILERLRFNNQWTCDANAREKGHTYYKYDDADQSIYDYTIKSISPSVMKKGLNKVEIVVGTKWGKDYKLIVPVIGYPPEQVAAPATHSVTRPQTPVVQKSPDHQSLLLKDLLAVMFNYWLLIILAVVGVVVAIIAREKYRQNQINKTKENINKTEEFTGNDEDEEK